MLRNEGPPCDSEAREPRLLVAGCSVLIRSRWLQVLSYALAESCSSATLLDDYVRAALNISHHILTAWHNIAVAAHYSGGRRVWGNCGERCTLLEDSTGEQMDRLRWEREVAAVRSVKLVYHVVVTALLQQFLGVPISESYDTVLRDLLVQPRRKRRRGVGDSRFTELGDVKVDEVLNCNSSRARGEGYVQCGGDRERSDCCKQSWRHLDDHLAVSVLSTLSPWTEGSDDKRPVCDGLGSAGDDFFVIDLRLFMRAAVAMNPTACALQLISRSVVRARGDLGRSSSDGGLPGSPLAFSALDPGVSEATEDHYFVLVASRDVAACQHVEPCFGNRKFIFVRCAQPVCEGPTLSRCGGVGAVDRPATEKAACGSGGVDSISLTASRESGELSVGDGDAWDDVLRSMKQLCHGLRRGVLGVPVPSGAGGTVPRLDSSRGRQETERLSLSPLSSNCGYLGRECEGGDVLPWCMNSGEANADEQSSEDGNDKDSLPWFIMYSDRCSATGSFFTGSGCSWGRLIAPLPAHLGLPDGATLTADYAPCVGDLDTSLEQAIFLSPSAGHDVHYRGKSSAGVVTNDSLVMAGNIALAEEVAARLQFWCTRGSPRRCYYDPVILNGVKDGMTKGTGDVEHRNSGDAGRREVAGGCSVNWTRNEMPLMLLLTKVGTISFQPLKDAVYCNLKSRELFSLAVTEATEMVICGTRESRAHSGWHDHRGEGCGKRDTGANQRCCRGRCGGVGGVQDETDLTLSAQTEGTTYLGLYQDVAVEVCVRWSQGEVDGGCYGNSGAAEGTNRGDCGDSVRRPRRGRLLSRREQNHLKSERLKMEYRLAHSDRLDALLINRQSADPIASVTLVPSLGCNRSMHSATRVVQDTRFVVRSFSHYVMPLLKHLREEKVLMIDLDRTLVDNAIISSDRHPRVFPESSLWSAECDIPMSQQGEQFTEPEVLERHCEASGTVSYFVSNDFRCGVRSETVYVRRGVRGLLRNFAVEWGIPLLLVTKSSRYRAEAILRKVLDPEGELFPIGCGRVYAAEFLAGEAPQPDVCLHGSGSHCGGVGNADGIDAEAWRAYQRRLCDCRKSASAVLRSWSCLRPSVTGVSSVRQARSVAVLDDMPHQWDKSDWTRTVAIAPYTLYRVDPDEYFSTTGLIASLLLSVLYNRNSLLCPSLTCVTAEEGAPVGCGVMSSSESVCNPCAVALERSAGNDSFFSTCESNDVFLGYHGTAPRPPTPHFAHMEGVEGVFVEEEGATDDVVVEEAHSPHSELSLWANDDVEDVVPL